MRPPDAAACCSPKMCSAFSMRWESSAPLAPRPASAISKTWSESLIEKRSALARDEALVAPLGRPPGRAEDRPGPVEEDGGDRLVLEREALAAARARAEDVDVNALGDKAGEGLLVRGRGGCNLLRRDGSDVEARVCR